MRVIHALREFCAGVGSGGCCIAGRFSGMIGLI